MQEKFKKLIESQAEQIKLLQSIIKEEKKKTNGNGNGNKPKGDGDY